MTQRQAFDQGIRYIPKRGFGEVPSQARLDADKATEVRERRYHTRDPEEWSAEFQRLCGAATEGTLAEDYVKQELRAIARLFGYRLKPGGKKAELCAGVARILAENRLISSSHPIYNEANDLLNRM